MRAVALAATCIVAVVSAGEQPVTTQSPPTIDFARDVQPLLQRHCIGCHGPSQQMGGYRLDRRGTALAGALRAMIIPGSSESSRLYRRIVGSEFGTQMPPTGALAPADVDTLKRWIDQGAAWPDALANDAPSPVPDAAALRVIEALRTGDAATVRAEVARDRQVVNARGRAGATPLMYAAVYGDAELLRQMLDAGGDPNIGNEAGATALMWATDSESKTRLLLARGADPNARSGHGRTALLLAAGQLDAGRMVPLLLERGATVPPGALPAAAGRGNVAVVRLLLKAGAPDPADAAIAALRANCTECLEAIASVQPLPPLRGALLALLPPAGGRLEAVRQALRLGAEVNATDALSRTVLMKAVLADQMTPAALQALLDAGADVAATSPDGYTALDYARAVGNPAIIGALEKAGARSAGREDTAPGAFVSGNSIRAAVERTLPLLQRSAVAFYRKSGCVSCHHNALTAMTVAAAGAAGVPVAEDLRRRELETVTADAAAGYDVMMQGLVPFGGGPPSVGYVLLGLGAEKHQPDLTTDAMVRLLRMSQLPDGRWQGANRPPHEASEFTYTAVNLRGIQQFQPSGCIDCARTIERAVDWLAHAVAVTTEDRVFRVFGLAWGGAGQSVLRNAVDELLSTQRSDGGWAQLPSLQSDAYATGEALVALHEAGVSTTSDAYQRGTRFLLRTQLQDGSWFVRKRAHPTQPYFESGFPHGVHQFISTAATNWATLALIAAR